MVRKEFIYWISLLLLMSCSKSNELENADRELSPAPQQHYRSLPASFTNVHFANNIRETQNFNYFLYPFIYFGGGVAIGDLNNDSLPDIYLTSNMSQNALYLNQGGLKFKEIGQSAGVEGVFNRWTTGATMADINRDGYLDIYVSVAGPRDERQNLLYLNQQNNTFTENAAQWGIDDNGHSMQSVFFDYDRDGDLDLYVGNYPPEGFGQDSPFFAKKTNAPDLSESDRLYRNEGDHFVDATREAGVLNYGLTLGLSVADFNNDGWPDLYVSNDFNSSDYLYINQGDGTFMNEITGYTRHTSNFGMGTDAADINNDGFVDLIQLDMMGSTNQQQKSNMSAMNPEEFYRTVDQGLHYQYMKNTLQLNTGTESFMDVGELAGIAYTDWSWGALLLDMNNNGHQDLFITNGMRRNVNDNDFNAYFRIQKAYNQVDPAQYLNWLQKIPVHPVENFTFLNQGDLHFRPVPENYGLDYRGFSQGAAYADLDSDGDLDMVVNNLDANTHIYENIIPLNTESNFLRLKLSGKEGNTWGIGTQVCIYTQGTLQCQDLYPTRGYQSSVEPILHFGLGDVQQIDSIKVRWPDEGSQTLYQVEANQLITLAQSPDTPAVPSPAKIQPQFVTYEPDLSITYTHRENEFNDFEREVLLPHKMSQFGPALSVADVNGDGIDDFYVGGAAGFSGQLYLQRPNGSFQASSQHVWQQDREHEDVGATFFDANGDDYPDLYVVSGGNEQPNDHAYYQDRLYLNDHQGGFRRVTEGLPDVYQSGSCVRAADFDGDGDEDLFVGGRQIPEKYPLPADSYLLRNDSEANRILFTDITAQAAPMLSALGMVTDATWSDINQDGWTDLIVVGDWMAVTVLHNQQGILQDVTADYGLDQQVGWWNSVVSGDVDQDGDMDLVVGNLGLNYKYKASETAPFKVYADDFDANGSLDIVLGYYEEGELYPLRGRECSSQQMPFIKKKIPNYTAFSQAILSDIYSAEKLDEALHYEATTFAHTVFINESGKFQAHPLPSYAQVSSVNAIVLSDLNEDDALDLFLGGNLYDSEVETPRNDASQGLFMTGDGNGHFIPSMPTESGIAIEGEIRAVVPIRRANQKFVLLVARNNDTLVLVERNND